MDRLLRSVSADDAVSSLMAACPYPERPFGGYIGLGGDSLAGGLAVEVEQLVFVDSFGTTAAEHRVVCAL